MAWWDGVKQWYDSTVGQSLGADLWHRMKGEPYGQTDRSNLDLDLDGFPDGPTGTFMDDIMGIDEPIVSSDNVDISDARTYANIQGSTVDEQLQWLVSHDPQNSQGWMEQLLGWRAENEAAQDARTYSKQLEDTRYQRAAKDLEAAGINPILAYQMVNGSAGNVAAAGYPDSNVSSNATSRENNKRTVAATNSQTDVKLVGVIGALIGIIIKAIL